MFAPTESAVAALMYALFLGLVVYRSPSRRPLVRVSMDTIQTSAAILTIAAIAILVPVLLPIAAQLGIDPVHLGIIAILNLVLGPLTPPVGIVPCVLSQVSGVRFERCVTATMPFPVPPVAVLMLMLIVFVPGFAPWPSTLFHR